MACGLGIGLTYNVRLTGRLSRMENALHMMDEKLCVVKPRTNEFARITKNRSAIEIERKALYAAYQVEKADFDSSHKMMGGGRISYAMLCNAWDDFQGGWKSIVTNWFYSTAQNDYERKWMKEYDVGVMDLKYSRDELKQVMYAWKSVSSGKGYFEKQDVCFTNGIVFFTNSEYACQMELKLLKSQLWVHEGCVFLFASSDVAGNGEYGSSDALMENRFLRFRGGTIECYCHFRHGCDAFEGLRYNFEPVNDCIVITSIYSGDIIGELYLGLREYTDSRGKKSPDILNSLIPWHPSLNDFNCYYGILSLLARPCDCFAVRATRSPDPTATRRAHLARRGI